MEQRNIYGYPVALRSEPFSDEWVRAVCLRLVLVTAMALGLALIPSLNQPAAVQPKAAKVMQAADPYAGMSDAELMAGVVLALAGE